MHMIRTDELLTTACFRGELERVREMLHHGAATSARCERLTTALHWAASMGHIDVCALLVERGADPNARSVNGESPLHVAAREGDATTADFLLTAGANPRLCNSAGRTALELALEFADDEVELIDLLRAAQAQHDARALGAAANIEAQPRRKVQIVWESHLQKQVQAASSTISATISGSVDSACGPDEPLDVSEVGADDATPPQSEAEALAARLATWGIAEPTAAPASGSPAAKSPGAAPATTEAGNALDADALSSLASRLFAWDAESKAPGTLPF